MFVSDPKQGRSTEQYTSIIFSDEDSSGIMSSHIFSTVGNKLWLVVSGLSLSSIDNDDTFPISLFTQ
jgi:hypothetical protein